ncbi:hypothetical protein [Chamaesiphon sp.]|uniref:hypothetical protein n=1 Tax=Chamaesiphon sp. TaxID=2814140 RepID=UPI003594676F
MTLLFSIERLRQRERLRSVQAVDSEVVGIGWETRLPPVGFANDRRDLAQLEGVSAIELLGFGNE